MSETKPLVFGDSTEGSPAGRVWMEVFNRNWDNWNRQGDGKLDVVGVNNLVGWWEPQEQDGENPIWRWWGEEGVAQARMPAGWEGNISAQLGVKKRRGQDIRFLVGRPGSGESQMKLKFLVPCYECAVPDIPRLTQGKAGRYPVGELKLLGVLWYKGAEEQGENEPPGPYLHIAWADQAGKFLGWEGIYSFEEMAKLGQRRTRKLQSLEDWDGAERRFRARGWGQEI